ncbi:NAD-binding protein [Iodobacter sp. LRB]|uniref:potassium channel family protein n=1 Tax=unclassified Iodobacter TaxID=235634 RepID=UPI000C1051C2|nr:potassium channel protein [Iodobacter sp. BJB302]PHV01786.1 potassium channel protein [Iodobacter sp. BJB302]
MPNIFFMVMRRMRAPIITLILIYSIAVLGLVLIPGMDDQGRPYQMGFFHAFYFISYTATSIGFGETPYAFSYSQRLWVLCCIYLSVTGWAYNLGAIFTLFNDQALKKAIQYVRFNNKVRRLREPFYLICGYGQTGRLLCKVLDRINIRFVVIELREERVNNLALADFHSDPVFYAGDASNPELLKIAGITHPRCRGVLAITGDENVNLAIAMAAFVLQPNLVSVCRCKNKAVADNMQSFGANKVINMFNAVGQRFQMLLHAPHSYRLWNLLSDFPGQPIAALVRPPCGHWVVVGYGRFGISMRAALLKEGATVTVIDPEPQPDLLPEQFVQALGVSADSLIAAGIEHASGLLVCHDHDINNLSALATARAINPKLFIVARQNLRDNHLLFEAFKPDITSIRSEIVAHECLRAIETPLLAQFLDLIKEEDEAWAKALSDQLALLCDHKVPEIWSITLDAKNTAAVHAFLANPSPPLRLAHLINNPFDHGYKLQCLPLLHVHGDELQAWPSLDTQLTFGDQLLFAGNREAQSAHEAMQEATHLLDFARTGKTEPQSWVFRKLADWQQGKKEGGV